MGMEEEMYPRTFEEDVALATDNLLSFLDNSLWCREEYMDAVYEASCLLKQAQLKEDAKRMRIDDRASYKKDMAEAKKQPKGALRDAAVKMAKDKRNLDKDIFKLINKEAVVDAQIRKNALDAQKPANAEHRLSNQMDEVSKDSPEYERLKKEHARKRRQKNQIWSMDDKLKKAGEFENKKTKTELSEKYPFAKQELEVRSQRRECALYKNLSGNRSELKGYRQRITEQILYSATEEAKNKNTNEPLEAVQQVREFFDKPLGKRDQFKAGVSDMSEALKAKIDKIKDRLVNGKEAPKTEAPKKTAPQAKKKLDISSDIKPKATTKSPDALKTVDAPKKDLSK